MLTLALFRYCKENLEIDLFLYFFDIKLMLQSFFIFSYFDAMCLSKKDDHQCSLGLQVSRISKIYYLVTLPPAFHI